MINTGAYHVYPREVEQTISAVPTVRHVVVRGEPDPTWGQAVTAYVVPSPDAPEDLIGIVRAECERRIARYKIPKRIHLVPSLDAVPTY
jgi:fatty-acyl-CoA synthase/long-chain acyl-CoA synthetase